MVTRSAHLFQVIWGPIYTNIKIYKQSTVSMSWYNMWYINNLVESYNDIEIIKIGTII